MALHKISIKLVFEFCSRAPLKILCFFRYFYFIKLILINKKFFLVIFFNILVSLSLTPTFIIHFNKNFFLTYAKIYISDKKKIACFLAYFYQVNLLKEKFFFNNFFLTDLYIYYLRRHYIFFQFYYFFLNI